MKVRPFGLGFLAGVLLPGIVVLGLAFGGALDDYMKGSRGYAMLPLLAPLGILAFLLGWRVFDRLQAPRMGTLFSLGLLAGGSLAGAVLLWVSSPERPPANRVVFSVFGGPLLCGFWLWIGGILGYAFRQQRATRRLAQGP